MRDLLISEHANELIEKGFLGNGCGSGLISKSLCWMAQKFIGVNLVKVWLYHDAEYSISKEHKSTLHKIEADSYAHHNINVLAGIEPLQASFTFKGRFAKVIHAMLIMHGSSSYWRK